MYNFDIELRTVQLFQGQNVKWKLMKLDLSYIFVATTPCFLFDLLTFSRHFGIEQDYIIILFAGILVLSTTVILLCKFTEAGCGRRE